MRIKNITGRFRKYDPFPNLEGKLASERYNLLVEKKNWKMIQKILFLYGKEWYTSKKTCINYPIKENKIFLIINESSIKWRSWNRFRLYNKDFYYFKDINLKLYIGRIPYSMNCFYYDGLRGWAEINTPIIED